MKKLFSLIILSAASLLPLKEAAGQSYRYANEALMLSRPGITGTARIRAMGGASASLGGDISSIFSNPAGLGFYNRSEISISPTFLTSANDSRYLGEAGYGYGTNLHVSNFGLVLSGQKRNDEGWLGGNLGISFQRLNNFNDKFSYQGTNPNSGLIDVLIENFDTGTEDVLTDLAFSTYLVGDYWDENGNPISTLVYPPDEGFPYRQSETVTRTGGQNQLSISYGGNIDDKFYIGAGIGFTSVDYRLRKTYTEAFQPNDPVKSFTVNEDQLIRGSGINATLGVIARPLEFLSVGISYATPTIYSLEEDYTTSLTGNYNDVYISDEILEGYNGTPFTLRDITETENTYYNFNLRTPGKLSLGSTVFFEKKGLITADVDFLNYGKSRLTDDNNSMIIDNQAIKEDYRSAVNVRLGGEYRYEIFRVRAGFAHIGDPYSNRNDWNRSMNIVSGGAGLKFRNYYVDLMVSQQTGDRYYYPYTFSAGSAFESPLVEMKNRSTTAMLTLGLTF